VVASGTASGASRHHADANRFDSPRPSRWWGGRRDGRASRGGGGDRAGPVADRRGRVDDAFPWPGIRVCWTTRWRVGAAKCPKSVADKRGSSAGRSDAMSKVPGQDAERNRRRRAEFLAGQSCVRCGRTDSLELDHIDPATKIDHRIWSWRKERREAEIAKCRVLCRTCHSEQHAQEMRERKGNGTLHGTRGGYLKRNCRCEACVAWRRAAWQRYNLKRRVALSGSVIPA
jgi:hypothetical protein